MLSEIDINNVMTLTRSEMLDCCRQQGVKVPWEAKSKVEVVRFLQKHHENILRTLVALQCTKMEQQEDTRRKRKAETQRQRRVTNKKQRSEADQDPQPFLSLPSPEELRHAQKKFLDYTSNAALELCVCVCCAREMFHSLGQHCHLHSLQHPEHLIPRVKHPAHETIDSMLVAVEHISTVDKQPWGWFCNECLKAINSDRLPPLALANRMWIGKIPPELSDLTVPEQILVSIYHPRCYVYKLHPRDLWSNEGVSSFHQNKLRGNVTTYELNTPDIVRMVEGTLVPHPKRILSSLIAVSLIGAGPVPKSWLKKTFSVRREVVRTAIHDAELGELPLGDVPDEIIASIQYELDISKAQHEAESYLQNDLPTGPSTQGPKDTCDPSSSNLDNQLKDPTSLVSKFEHSEGSNENVPDAIPLQFLGTVPTDLSKLSTEELFLYRLAKTPHTATTEGGYAVRPGKAPVPDFGRTKCGPDGSSTFVERNLSVYAFPFLYPYGEGGIETERDIPVSLQDHIRCNLQYSDRRFRTHPTWPFVFFGLLQKRQMLNAAHIQTRRKDFDCAAEVWDTLTQKDFDEAAESEKKGFPILNPKILLLRRFLTSAGTKVMGSDASRAAYRSQIWSTMLVKNPPSLWVTINPNDLHDPIVQVLAGKKIDMDNFVSTAGPDRQKRAENITKDPYACAQYFQFVVTLILEQLFGISVIGRKVHTRMGVLGRLSAYYGVVEAQGRGSLHVHMLLWLEDAPSADTMHKSLADPEFRRRVAQYVDHNVRAHLDGLNAETIQELEKDAELGYSRPPHPDSTNYEREFAIRELHFVRSQQFHKCKTSTCLVETPHSKERVCKRRALFTLAPETMVTEDGHVIPKRTFGYLNNWNPTILVFVGCNNDIKFLSNGFDARAVIWYVTGYQTKKQRRSHNASALLADGIAYHLKSSDYLDNIRQRNRLLVSRCLRILNQQMEQSAPQVISYLMGYGDTFCSHSYIPLYWSSVAAEIYRSFPDLKHARCTTQDRPVVNPNTANQATICGSDYTGKVDNQEHQEPKEHDTTSVHEADDNSDSDDEEVIVETSPTGSLVFRSQLTDYKLRGHEFENMGYVQFVVDTWEYNFTKDRKGVNGDSAGGTQTRKQRHARGRYLPEHPRAKTHERVKRAEDHNTLPNIVGPYLPRSDLESTYDFYCASMLALLVPWRHISDLKLPGLSWAISFASFLLSANQRDLDFISAAQYYYQCKEAVNNDRKSTPTIASQLGIPMNPDLDADSDHEDDPDQDDFLLSEIIQPPRTEAELEEQLTQRQNPREHQHGKQAVDIAMQAGLFKFSSGHQWQVKQPFPSATSGQDLESIQGWRVAMQEDLNARREAAAGTLRASALIAQDVGQVMPVLPAPGSLVTSVGSVTHEPAVQEEIQNVDISKLTADQKRAYCIIEAHLEATIARKQPQQLLMQIQGEGGTGKSTVIGCVTELFKSHGRSHKLIRSAYTGIAASLIDGNTLHTLCRITSHRGDRSAKVLEALRKTWRGVEYLVIDEVSMISRSFFARISAALGQANQLPDGSTEALPFGGINVILTGDFHQFPPVACALSAALYCSTSPKDTVEAAVGAQLYQAFRIVVILQEQCRTTDKKWLDVLQHARHGTCTSAHLDIIRGLVLSLAPDSALNSEEWEDAVLVTPRHGVRLAWNKMASLRHCAKTGAHLFHCPAEDTIDNRRLTIAERWEAGKKVPHRKSDRGQRMKANLPDVVDLAVGMEVMVTYNVETELDVANGSRGIVERIILDHREELPAIPEQNTHGPAELSLTYPPECVLVRLYRTKAAEIGDLGPGVVPIFPMTRKYEINRKRDKPAPVTRRQLPITAAYAFTDYRSQGQTIKKVIVDIARPPSGGLTPFNAYVALSRSSGTKTIRLLRDFDDALFQQIPSHELEAEDRRLLALNNATKLKWERGLPVWENSSGFTDEEILAL